MKNKGRKSTPLINYQRKGGGEGVGAGTVSNLEGKWEGLYVVTKKCV